MIELSLGKLMLLALVALIVLGPEKLPQAARTAGALVRRLRSGWDSVRAEVERELEIEDLKRTAREAAAKAEALQKQATGAVLDANATMRHTREQVEAAAAETKKDVAQIGTLKEPDSGSLMRDTREQHVETATIETKQDETQIDAPKESEHGSV